MSVTSCQITNTKKKFILKEDLSDFTSTRNYIPNLFEYLWENPELISNIILNCEINEVKNTLANLFMNNFYHNILSCNYIENNLIYVLTLLLKDEINNLKNIDDSEIFLGDDSRVGYMISELRKKNDVQCFFKNSILNIISDLESMSSINFTLEIEKMINILTKKATKKKLMKENRKIVLNQTSKIDINEELIPLFNSLDEIDNSGLLFFDQEKSNTPEIKIKFDNFTGKYLTSINLSDLEKMKTSEEIKQDMNDYLNNIISKAKNENSYSNFLLIQKLYIDKNLTDKLICQYINNFYFIKDFIDKFISILGKYLYLLPFSVKCFCKIIAVLIQKKFPNINISQKNAFISQFFFQKIIKPILDNPGIELFINNFIISGYTISNLKIINDILNKLFSFQLFEANNDNLYNNYTPFNWYFLEKIPEILEIFNKITDIELPQFIDDLINDKLDKNFTYDYFNLNKEDLIMHYSICFNCYDIIAILDGISKLKNKIDITNYKNGINILKSFEKLSSEKSRKELNQIKRKNYNILCEKDKDNKKNNNQIKDINYQNYYLIQKLKINNENKILLKLKLGQKENFNLKEINLDDNPEHSEKNKIIKTKNFLCDLLYNIRPLKISDFSQCNISDIKNILNSIKNFSKISKNSFDDSIPPEWYVESLLNLLGNIPEDYISNDYDKIFSELKEEINHSIKNFNIDFLYECFDRLKYVEKEKHYYEEILKVLKDLELNDKAINIIENDYIPVKISFNYGNKNLLFDISKLKLKKEEFHKKENKEISKSSQIYTRFCYSIKSFIEKFPDFSIFQQKQDIDILELQKSLSVPYKLREYFFSIIHEHLTNEIKTQNGNDILQTENIIYDYVMSKINPKIFPKTDDEDDKIFKTLFTLSWVEPKHFIQGKSNYIFNTFLPEVISYFHSIENELSPRRKIYYVNAIFDSIIKVVKFNGGNTMIGVDDQLPILSYCFVKAQLSRICSNLKFIQLYRNSLIEKGNESQLVQLISSCAFFKNITYQNLTGVSEEEYNKNCNDVINSL